MFMRSLRKAEKMYKKRMQEEEKEVEKKLDFNTNPSNFALVKFNQEIYERNSKFIYQLNKSCREEIVYFKGAYLVASQLKDEIEKRIDKEWKEFPLAVTRMVGGKEATIHGILDPTTVITNKKGLLRLKEDKDYPLDTERLEEILRDRIDRKSLEKLLGKKGFNWNSTNYSSNIFII